MTENAESTFTNLLELAKMSDGPSQRKVAVSYRDGIGVERNIGEAINWMRKAADEDIISSRCELFDMLWERGADGDYDEMISVINPLVEKNDAAATVRFGRAYLSGRGVEKNVNKAILLISRSADLDPYWTKEFFGTLMKHGTTEIFIEMMDFIIMSADRGCAESMGNLGRIYRDGRGVEKDFRKAAEWMRKAAEKNVAWAKNELFDILWNIDTPESMEEMISVATEFAEKGDGNAMGRLGRAYRHGKGVPQDLDKAAEWMRKAAEKNVAWAKNEIVNTLLCEVENTGVAYQEAFKICINDRDKLWAKKILPYLYYNGIGVEKDVLTAKKMWIEQNVQGLYGSIKPAFVINSSLFEYNNVVLVGTVEEIMLLFSICLQYNIRPDYYWMTSDYEVLPEYYGNQFKLGSERWTRSDKKAFLTFSFTDILESVADECIFYVKKNAFSCNESLRSPLLIYNPIIQDKQVFVYMEKGASSKLKNVDFYSFAESIEEVNLASIKGKTVIIHSENIVTIKNLMNNNEVFVDFEPFYIHNTYIFTNSGGRVRKVHLKEIDKKYFVGREIFKGLCPKYQYLITLFFAMGDQFRSLSKRKGVDYSTKRFIVTESARDLLSINKVEGIILSIEQHRSLTTYLSITENYNSNVLMLAYRPIYPGVGWNSDLNTILMTGNSRKYNLKDIEGLDCSDPDYMISTTKRNKRILLNPYGNNIRNRDEVERKKTSELFKLLAIILKDDGHSVFTNTPFLDQKEIPGTTRYEKTIADFIQDSTTFDFMVSVFTGFMEVAMLTDINLIVLVPGNNVRTNFSKLCCHNNYWEYDIMSDDIQHILEEIVNLMKVKTT